MLEVFLKHRKLLAMVAGDQSVRTLLGIEDHKIDGAVASQELLDTAADIEVQAREIRRGVAKRLRVGTADPAKLQQWVEAEIPIVDALRDLAGRLPPTRQVNVLTDLWPEE